MKETQIPYQWIATGILIGYLMPYVITLIKSYSQKESSED